MEPEKLSQLRAKTDRQLLDFIHSKLELGLNFAAMVEVLYADGNRESARRSLERSKRALTSVEQLLPVIAKSQRRELDPKVNDLLAALDRLRWAGEAPRVQTASSY